MKKFFVAAVLAVTLLSMGCKPTNDSKPTTNDTPTPDGGQPGSSTKPDTNP